MWKSTLTLSAAGLLVMAAALPAQATQNSSGNRSVEACSKWHSSRCISGAVRNTALGPKVQLRGGTWTDCRGDCRDTLRRSTVDFWMEHKLSN